MSDLTMMTMEQISTMVEKGEVSPVELVEACLKRIEALNPDLNAYVYLAAE